MSCKVVGCSNYNRKKNMFNVKFYRFPEEKELKEKWAYACGLEKNAEGIEKGLVCSEHFDKADLNKPLQQVMLNYSPPRRRRIGQKAIPNRKLISQRGEAARICIYNPCRRLNETPKGMKIQSEEVDADVDILGTNELESTDEVQLIYELKSTVEHLRDHTYFGTNLTSIAVGEKNVEPDLPLKKEKTVIDAYIEPDIPESELCKMRLDVRRRLLMEMAKNRNGQGASQEKDHEVVTVVIDVTAEDHEEVTVVTAEEDHEEVTVVRAEEVANSISQNTNAGPSVSPLKNRDVDEQFFRFKDKQARKTAEVQRQNAALEFMRKQIQELNSQLKQREKEVEELKKKNQEKEEILNRFFTKAQIDRLHKRLTNWTTADIADAMSLKSISVNAYIYLKNKKGFPLPSLSTLRRQKYSNLKKAYTLTTAEDSLTEPHTAVADLLQVMNKKKTVKSKASKRPKDKNDTAFPLTKKRKCGFCREPGHDKLTCPIINLS